MNFICHPQVPSLGDGLDRPQGQSSGVISLNTHTVRAVYTWHNMIGLHVFDVSTNDSLLCLHSFPEEPSTMVST